MKFKQIALISSLFFICPLAMGASSGSSDKRLNKFLPSDLNSTSNTLDSSFNSLQSSLPKKNNNQQKQDYLEVLKLLKDRKFSSAESKIDSLLKQFPNEDHFYNLRATLELSKQNFSLAIKSYQKAIELNPKNISSQLGIAKIFLKLGKLSQAKKHANSALSINNYLVYPYFFLAEVAYKKNKLQDVEDLLLTAQKKVRGDVKQELMVAEKLADFYVMQKQADKALSVAQNTIKQYPKNSSALALLASAQFFNNQPEQAISTLKQLIRQESQDVRHRLLLAKILFTQTGMKHPSLKLLDEVNSIAPQSIQVQTQRAIILTQLKLYQEALRAAKKVKQLAPDSGLAETLEGEIYLAEKKLKLALAAFKKSHKIRPEPKVLNIIIDLLTTENKQADAIRFLKQALQKDPQNLTAHFKLGNIYQQQNNNDKAKKHYQAVLAKQPNNALILNNLAWIYHQENNPKDLKFAKRAYQISPKSADIADTYAVILIKQGDVNKGIEIFQAASKLAPDNNDIQYRLANAYVLKGQTKQAIDILKNITHSEQGFAEKDAAISLLSQLE